MEPHDGISALVRKERDQSSVSLSDLFLFFLSLSLPCEDTTRKWPSTGQEESFHREPFRPDLDLGLPGSRTVRNRCLLFKPPSP